jgi:putative two-component system response regulator
MKVLVADDNPFYRASLRGTLQAWGYEVVEAKDGRQAFEILIGTEAPMLAILDSVMPGLSGPDVCRRVRAMHQPESPYLIILSGQDSQEDVVGALQAGADDIIHKPFDHRELQARLQVGIRIVKLQTSQTMIFTLARAVEAKSPFTKGHSDRVTHFALALGRSIGLSEAELFVLRRGALLHDIGKISIPDRILDKPAPLTPEEYSVIQQHPMLGVEILKPLQTLDDIMPLVRSHHERCDGKGYPDGLPKKDIPVMVRVLSVADVYDALSSERPYRAAMGHLKSFKIMIEDAAKGGLDPDLVARFLELPDEVFDVTGKAVKHFAAGTDSMPIRKMLQQIA